MNIVLIATVTVSRTKKFQRRSLWTHLERFGQFAVVCEENDKSSVHSVHSTTTSMPKDDDIPLETLLPDNFENCEQMFEKYHFVFELCRKAWEKEEEVPKKFVNLFCRRWKHYFTFSPKSSYETQEFCKIAQEMEWFLPAAGKKFLGDVMTMTTQEFENEYPC